MKKKWPSPLKPGYRLLRAGEVIRQTDVWRHGDNPVCRQFGCTNVRGWKQVGSIGGGDKVGERGNPVGGFARKKEE